MEFNNEDKFIQLADELEKKDAFTYKKVIYRLRHNWYHDFLNPDEVPTPKMQMIHDFTDLGRLDIVARIKNGEFDQ